MRVVTSGTACWEPDVSIAGSTRGGRIATIDRLLQDPRTGSAVWRPLRWIVVGAEETRERGEDAPGEVSAPPLDLSKLTVAEQERFLDLLEKVRPSPAADRAPAGTQGPAALAPEEPPEAAAAVREAAEERRAAHPELAEVPLADLEEVAHALERNRRLAAERGPGRSRRGW